jgi:hypothetical protein
VLALGPGPLLQLLAKVRSLVRAAGVLFGLLLGLRLAGLLALLGEPLLLRDAQLLGLRVGILRQITFSCASASSGM